MEFKVPIHTIQLIAYWTGTLDFNAICADSTS